MRRRRRRPVLAREGDLVIDGHVHARLLGVPLLGLDAHVVVTTARPALAAGLGESLAPQLGAARSDGFPRRRAGAPARVALGASTPPGLARAEHLIAEGTDLLDEASRIH